MTNRVTSTFLVSVPHDLSHNDSVACAESYVPDLDHSSAATTLPREVIFVGSQFAPAWIMKDYRHLFTCLVYLSLPKKSFVLDWRSENAPFF